MRLFVATAICAAALYTVDALWFRGTYYDAVRGMIERVVVHFR